MRAGASLHTSPSKSSEMQVARLRAAADVHVLGVGHALGGPAPEARLGVLLVLQRALLPGRQVRPGAP